MERIHRLSSLEEVRHDAVPKIEEIHCGKTITTPVGPIYLVASDIALISLQWGRLVDSSVEVHSISMGNSNPVLKETEIQLEEYFLGKRRTFDIPLAPRGTEFQKRVWDQLLKIPYGKYITYGEQAVRLGQPKAARAVGAANGKNPIGIIIPCHRVLGSSGCLTGFAGGLEMKRKLLALEGVQIF